MIKKILNYSIIIASLSNFAFAGILVDSSGKRFLTLGSTKDEVLEILGTPDRIFCDAWYYQGGYISFDDSNCIKEYSNAKNLKIVLVHSKSPKYQSKKFTFFDFLFD